MAFTGVGPGRRSLVGLGWLVRAGASPVEPLALVMGWSERVAHDHVRRLTDAGLVRRERMTQGSGSLVIATSRGAIAAGYPARMAARSIGPSNWSYAVACAWVAGWLQRRGSEWWGERQVGADEFWRWDAICHDRRGMSHVLHRPALGLKLNDGYGAIEVLIHQKPPARLLATMRMYEGLTCGSDSLITGVLIVTGDRVIADQVRRAAAKADLYKPVLKLRSLAQVIEQTRTGDFPVEPAGEPAGVDAGSNEDTASMEPEPPPELEVEQAPQQPDEDDAAPEPNETQPRDREPDEDQGDGPTLEDQAARAPRRLRWGRRSRAPEAPDDELEPWFARPHDGGDPMPR